MDADLVVVTDRRCTACGVWHHLSPDSTLRAEQCGGCGEPLPVLHCGDLASVLAAHPLLDATNVELRAVAVRLEGWQR